MLRFAESFQQIIKRKQILNFYARVNGKTIHGRESNKVQKLDVVEFCAGLRYIRAGMSVFFRKVNCKKCSKVLQV